MRTIWKFTFAIDDEVSIEMPQGAEVLTARVTPGQSNLVDLWAAVDGEASKEERMFRIHGTGHPLRDSGALYVCTTFDDVLRLVWHIYEVVQDEVH